MRKLWKIVQSQFKRFARKAKITPWNIQMLITARSLEGTIIIVYMLAPHEETIHLEVVPFPYPIVYGSYNT